MTSVHSLEQERQAILDRMQMRREAYRRLLHGDDTSLAAAPARAVRSPAGAARRLDGSAGETPTYRYQPVQNAFPRISLSQVVRDHPVLCALGVAALLAIGPRRLARGLASGSAALGAVATSQSRTDMLGRVLTLATAFAQSRKH